MTIFKGQQQLHQPICYGLSRRLSLLVSLAIACGVTCPADAQTGLKMEVAISSSLAPPQEDSSPILKLGAGDAVNIQVYGRPELSTTTYVSDDGTIPVPLAGAVQVAGLSPATASLRVASALRSGQFLLNPQVTIILNQFRSQQVSVLGEVKSPARFPVESKLTVFDLLAQAGGVTENGADVIYMLRTDKDGHVTRYPVDLKGLTDGKRNIPSLTLRGGDVIYVPRASQFYIYGEVQAPNMYRLEPGMTVLQAISRGGGITQRGSDSRIEIRRRTADGAYQTVPATLTDQLQADDVLRIKERIF
jgi:polysaccharide export outer membrane protein